MWQVTLLLPWLAVSDQRRLFPDGLEFATPDAQEAWVRLPWAQQNPWHLLASARFARQHAAYQRARTTRSTRGLVACSESCMRRVGLKSLKQVKDSPCYAQCFAESIRPYVCLKHSPSAPGPSYQPVMRLSYAHMLAWLHEGAVYSQF